MNADRIRRVRERTQDKEEDANPCRIRVDKGPLIPASTINRQAQEFDLALGGPREKAPQCFRIRKALYPNAPIPSQTKITLEGGREYRVTTVDGDQPSSPAWLCVCDPWTR